MRLNLTKIFAIACLTVAIALTTFNPILAATTDAKATLDRASTEVVKDTGAKEQFGRSENGDRLIDKAQEKASKKLDNLAKEADSSNELAGSKKLFIKNLSN